jgi:hypothetical protein
MKIANVLTRYVGPGLALLILLAAGCTKNPFSTRNSEDPLAIGGTYTDPVTPAIAIENLYYACNEQNIGNFSRTLADQFVFTFDFLASGVPGELTQWPSAQEIQISERMFRSLEKLQLSWSPSQVDIEDDTSAVMYRNYSIMAITADDPPETTFYAGEAILHVRVNESSRWLIQRWEDRHLTDQPYSWADLKAGYR